MERKQLDHVHTKKKIKDTTREVNTPLFYLRCCQLGLSMSDLDYLTMGMVYDMLTECNNDNYDYSIKATQDDYDNF